MILSQDKKTSNPPRPPPTGESIESFLCKRSKAGCNNQINEQGFIWSWICECCVAGEMFGMKFRDRELPAPPLDNNSQSSMESTKKTSVETTRRSLRETTTSKTSLETVKKMEVASPKISPHFLRANGRLPSCLEVRFEHLKFSQYVFSFARCLVSPGTNQWTGKLLKRWSNKVFGEESSLILMHTLTFYILLQLERMVAFWCETADMEEWTAPSPSPSSTTTRSSTSASG